MEEKWFIHLSIPVGGSPDSELSALSIASYCKSIAFKGSESKKW